ncbi:hypothetical protein EE612_032347 [Oryza sativa]|nr:hypothetical protein EE612_032347 [Oryza sativa]
MAVEMVESSMVTAGEATPEHRIWLSNLDLLVARSHTPTVYVYRRTGSDSDAAFFLAGRPQGRPVQGARPLLPPRRPPRSGQRRQAGDQLHRRGRALCYGAE